MSKEMKMFCYQCQEAQGGKGCSIQGMCGKMPTTSNLQDKLILESKKLSEAILCAKIEGIDIPKEISQQITLNLFVTITNANFDDDAIKNHINKTKDYISKLLNNITSKNNLKLNNLAYSNNHLGPLSTVDEDVRSLRELTLYGLKGMAAYLHHANTLSYEDEEIENFIHEALVKISDDSLNLDNLIELVMKTGEYGVKTMALLDKANTSTYGNPEISKVNIGTKNNPAILISGHDLKDLEMLLEQTKGTNIDVYTHSEMLPAHYYPFFKKYPNLVGNYGNAWHNQTEEFKNFNGPILFTTNCIVPPKKDYIDRVYTTGAAGFKGCKHIKADEKGFKDFSEIINHAKKSAPPIEIETGNIIGGFAHQQVFALADKVVEAIKGGHIKKFVVMGGCDGRFKQRDYYKDFAEKLPKDSVILTAGCAKYRYNKLNLGDILGIPRVLDAGQCNDSYSLVIIALKLKEIFNLDDINKLPIIYNIAWYEQKAVIVLLALLFLGVKNIHLGPTLPAFISENVLNVLVNNFGIAGISNVDDDLKKFFDNKEV